MTYVNAGSGEAICTIGFFKVGVWVCKGVCTREREREAGGGSVNQFEKCQGAQRDAAAV